jgi:hypothetical protein
MKKFSLPSFPVSSRFDDQESFAKQSRQVLAEIIRSGAGDFGVVYCGVGGGYLVNFSKDDYWCHPVEDFVAVVKPDKEPANAAEHVEAEWGGCKVKDEEERWARGLDWEEFNLSEINVEYLFETDEEAQAWLEEYEQENEEEDSENE